VRILDRRSLRRNPEPDAGQVTQVVPADTAATAAPADERVTVLQTFKVSLEQESHILREHPGLLWQQMCNRLQWDDEPVPQVLATGLAQRCARGVSPWLRARTPARESNALVRTFIGHFEPVHSCGFSPDGRLLVSADRQSVRLWDVETGTELRAIGHGAVTTCAFSPDGRFIVSGSEDGTVKLWDVYASSEMHTLNAPGLVTACAVSPDGRFVLAGGLDELGPVSRKALRLWDADSGSEIATFEEQPARACAFSPDGRFIASAHDCAPLNDKFEPKWGGVRWVTPDRRRLLLSPPGTVCLWDRERRKKLHALPYGLPCLFSPDGSFVVSADIVRDEWGDELADVTALKFWDPKSGKELRTITVEIPVRDECAVSPDGRWLVVACKPATLRLIDAESGAALGELAGHVEGVNACAFSPDGRFIVSASDDHTLKLWDVDEAVRAGAPSGGSEGATGDAASPEDPCADRVATNESGNVRSPDGRSLVNREYEAVLFESAGDGPGRLFFVRDGLGSATFGFGPNGHLYVIAGADTEVREETGEVEPGVPGAKTLLETGHGAGKLWDCDNKAKPRALGDLYGVVGDIAFSPDGRFVVSTTSKWLRRWDVAAGAEPARLDGQASAFAVSPDARFIFSASDAELALWDVETGTKLAMLPISLPLSKQVSRLSFDPASPQVICTIQEDIYTDGRHSFVFERRAFDLVGIEYGPGIVTASEQDGHLAVRCPCCGAAIDLERSKLGRELACPHAGCGRRLRLNTFTVT